MSCPSCQAPVTPGAVFCFYCGHRLAQAAQGGAPLCARHPELQAAHTCVRCGSFACVQCLVPVGEQLWCSSCRARGADSPLPWDRREELGLFRAFWQTCTQLLARPNVTLGSAQREGSLGSSLGFAALANLVGMFTTVVLYGLIVLGTLLFISGRGTEPVLPQDMPLPAIVGIGVGAFVFYLGLMVGIGLVSILLMGAVDHLVLQWVGANPVSYQVTVRANALALAPYLIGLLPICGLYVFPVWALVLKVLAYKNLHRTTGGKAAAGALIPIGILVGLAVVGYAIMLVAVGATMQDFN